MAKVEKPVELKIVSRSKVELQVKTPFMVLPALDGDIGVGFGHAPFLSPLRPGQLRYMPVGGQEGAWKDFELKGGLVKVLDDQVLLLLS